MQQVRLMLVHQMAAADYLPWHADHHRLRRNILYNHRVCSDPAVAADVAVASREQSDGIVQISQAVMQLDQATQQNAALVEETSAATSNLDDQVQSLKQQISRFRLA